MTDKKRVVNLPLTDELLKRIEDYRFSNRFPTRLDAIRALLEYALAVDESDR